jgi:drug/metabolite transporter (DMT)-like permease
VDAAGFALLGALSWGTGDFFGGLASRKTHVLTVLAISQAVGLVGVLGWALASGAAVPGAGDALPAAGAGAAGAVGLAALYRAMAVGAMGIVAPISALSPVVPLAVDAGRGIVPTGLQWTGIASALAGVVLLAREPIGAARRGLAAGVSLALVAALGFGLFVVGLDAASDGGATWAVAIARASSTALSVTALLALRAPRRPPAALLPTIAAVGVFDTTANVLVAIATTRGSAGIVAVLSALYPLATIALARIFLSERLDRHRRVGGVLALGGAALVAVG